LVRKGAPSLSVKGPGETTVDQAGQLQFGFAVPKEQYQPYVTARLAKPRPVPDDPKDEDYFELTAIAFSGEIFRGRLLHPEVSNLVPEGFWNGPGIAEGKVHQLELKEQALEEPMDSASFVLPKKLLFPHLNPAEGISPKDSGHRK